MHKYKRYLLKCIAGIGVAVFLTVGNAWAEEIGYVNSTNGLNLRTGPGTQYDALTVIG